MNRLICWLFAIQDNPFNRNIYGKNITKPIITICDEQILLNKLSCIKCHTLGAVRISKNHDGKILRNITCSMCGQTYLLNNKIIQALKESK